MRSLQRLKLKQHHATYCGLVEAPSGRCRLIRPPRGVRVAGDHITLRTEGDPTNLWKVGSGGIWSLRRNPQIRADFLPECIQTEITACTKI